jgi:hypothetical protein
VTTKLEKLAGRVSYVRHGKSCIEMWCQGCGQFLPADSKHFYASTRNRTGFQTPCKECVRINGRVS